MTEKLRIKHHLALELGKSIKDQQSSWKNWLSLKTFELLANDCKDESVTNLAGEIGTKFGQSLRQHAQYENTQQRVIEAERQGINLEDIAGTPPVGLNLRLLLQKESSVAILRENLEQKPIDAAIFGLAIVEGVPDFQKFLQTTLETNWNQLSVIDIDSDILKAVDEKQFQQVTTLHQDARQTSLHEASQQLVLRDHIDNCCPPAISRSINEEVTRVLDEDGVAIVNITTSDELTKSLDREIISHHQLQTILPSSEAVHALQTRIFDLNQLKEEFGEHLEFLRGKIVEIEPEGESFVVFAEDESGHGEWFRSFNDHLKTWEKDGLIIADMQDRIGIDSHQPPLSCHRHIVLLTKKTKERIQ
ncbi:MAG: hypothetical protein A2383_03780 [Candidatus Pacebacteria bacterium RIFOXYB1_FULL_39_46]|nr:MAG: hypothetical protein A2182_04035 [Candidatus Pacebacteria bacterium RIFOXYA1_FULL_38_18]OGJ38536.1 MAG: hypothetical protein A2383_03780 [Candidatus Pacebacteria bacterium RIFOXYB1_FULL_39_46]OGJ40396.1 MAG: hypothetical protein A2411_03920 [Candidatus Pacebacteria bacterium RIFOXYC1_FULL_39_21]OGJ40515.1 MAG: hypothetical protein A2582_02665 [Candidatus Pacebacteria bacterium RIFOXYD1_FULL_39_27]